MAPTTIISMVSALLFLPIALCRPLEVPSGLLPEKSSETVSPPTNYREQQLERNFDQSMY